MAGVNVDFSSQGGDRLIGQLRDIDAGFRKTQQAVSALANESKNLSNLATTLNTTATGAAAFAKQIGLTAGQSQQALKALTQLNQSGASLQDRFSVLNKTLGLNFQQFTQLDSVVRQSIASQRQAAQIAQQSSQGYIALSKALGLTFTQAQQLGQGLGLSSRAIGDAVTKIQALNGANATTQQKFNALNKELGLSSEQFLKLDKAVDEYNASVARTAAETTKANEALRQSAIDAQKAEQAQQQLEDGYRNIGIAAAGLSAAIGGIFVKGTQEFIEFDNAIRQSGVISGDFGTPQFEALRQEVERLGIETSKTPAEIAQMSVELSRAGFSAEQTTGALQSIVRASEATGESLSTVGDIIAKTYRTFERQFEESGTNIADATQLITDALVATANATNTSVSGLGESFKFIGAQAASSNQPVQDTLVLLGLLGDAGIQGSQAGTNLAQAIERIKLASAGAETEFTGLVRGSARMTEAFQAISADVRNADGSMKSILDVLPVIQQNLNGFSQQDQEVLMKALFGIEGGRAFQTLLNVTPDRLAEVTEQVRNSGGAAELAGQQLQQGLGGALRLLEGSVGAASAEVGNFVEEGLEPLVRGATATINAFLALPDPIKAVLIATTGLAGVLSAAVAALTAYNLASKAGVISSTAQAIATIKNTVATTAGNAATTAAALSQTAFAIATGKATVAQVAQARAIAASAARLGLLAVAAGSIALVADTFGKVTEASGETRDRISELNTKLAELREAQARVADTSEEAGSAIDAAVNKNIENLTSQLGGIQNFIDRIRDAIPGLATAQEAGINQQTIAFGELLTTTDEVLTAFEDLQSAPGGIASATEEEVQGQVAAIEASIAALQAEAPVTEAGIIAKNQYIQALERAKGALQGNTQETETLTTATEQQTRSLDDVTKAYDESQRAIVQGEAEKLREIQGLESSGAISAQDANQQRFEATQERIRQEIEAERKKLSDLEALGADSDPAKEAARQQAISDARTSIAQQETTLLQNEAKQQQEIEQQKVAAVKAAQDRALATIKQGETQRLIEIQRSLNAGVISQQKADELRLNSTRQTLEAELKAEEQNLARIRALPQPSDPQAREQREAQIRESIQRTSDLTLSLLENERQQEEAVRQAAIQSIRDRAAQQQQATDRSVASIERETAAYDTQTRALERQNALLQSQQALQDATANLNSTLSQNRIDGLSRALELTDRLNQTQDAGERSAIQNQLALLGVSGDRAQIAQQIADAERARAGQEAADRAIAQEAARRSLELELQREQISARRAVAEARINELKAKQAVLDAQSAQAEAQQIQDPAERQRALEAAQTQLDIAQQTFELSQGITQDATTQAEQYAEIAANRRQTLAIEQRAANATAESAANARVQNAELSAAAASAQRIGQNLTLGGGSPRSLRKGGSAEAGELLQVHKDEFFVPAQKGTVLNQRDSRAVVKEALSAGTGISKSQLATPIANIGEGALLKEVKQLRAEVKRQNRSAMSIGSLSQQNVYQVKRDEEDDARKLMNGFYSDLQRINHGLRFRR